MTFDGEINFWGYNFKNLWISLTITIKWLLNSGSIILHFAKFKFSWNYFLNIIKSNFFNEILIFLLLLHRVIIISIDEQGVQKYAGKIQNLEKSDSNPTRVLS